MEITQDQAIATLDDKDSAIEVLSEIYARITELKTERDQWRVKALARKLELDKKAEHEIKTDNFAISYRDSRGIEQIVAKSSSDGGVVKIIVMKDKG